MHNLEHITHQQVFDGEVSYSVWRKSLHPKYGIVWRDILLGYAGILVTVILYAWLPVDSWGLWILKLVAAILLFGFLLAYLSLFIHEASHYHLHPDKKINDRLAGYFLCALFGLHIRTYRKTHWHHHTHLGTPTDSETSYFNALTPRFLIESSTGIHLWRILKKKNGHKAVSPEMKRANARWLIAGGLVNICIILTASLLVHWSLSLAWILSMLIVFPFFATLRQILEHRDELAGSNLDFTTTPHGKITRIFTSGFMSRSFGGAGFNKHMIHHWDPQISYTRFKDVEAFLLRSAATKELIGNAKTTYWQAFKKLLAR
jgi:fatty acid desaturase